MNDRQAFPGRNLAGLALLLICVSALYAQRLPGTVRPEHYSITLTPDLKAATYSGSESIDVTLTQPTTTIRLNATEIAFKSAKVSAGGKEQTAAVTLDSDKQQATLTVPDQLPAGKAVISIEFTGTLNNELRGFYLSKTPKRNYAVTQFEAVDARRAFPCFDEPALKATFDVTLVVDAGDTAISNSPIASGHTRPRRRQTHAEVRHDAAHVDLPAGVPRGRFPMYLGHAGRRRRSASAPLPTRSRTPPMAWRWRSSCCTTTTTTSGFPTR